MTPGEEAAIAKIGAQVEGLSRRFDEHAQRTQKDLTEIKAEVKKTNGRVTTIENKEAREDGESSGRRGVGRIALQMFLAAVALVSAVTAVLAVLVTA